LGDVVQINPRVGTERASADLPVSFVPMAAVCEHTGRIVSSDVRPFGRVSKGFPIFAENDVLFAKITPCMENGKAAIARNLENGTGAGSTEFFVLRPTGRILSEYVFHFIRRTSFRATCKANFTGSAGQQRVPKSFLEKVAIPLPPVEEQRRIVGLLDRAAEIRRRADAARAKARAIIPALFLDTFGDPVTNPKGWPVRPLGETATFFGGATLPAGLPFAGQGGGYLLCKVSTLSLAENRNGIVSSIEWSGQPLARSAVAPFGSILFPKRGAAISTNKKRLLLRPGALDPNLMGVLGKPQFYIPGFLLSLFEAFDLMSIASGSTVPQLNKQDLYPLNKIVPPLQLQIDFAERADRLESLARHLDAAAAKAEAMAAGLSAEVFDAGQRKDTADGPSAQC
jgi:type I restriction enzyme S subunit